jgi:filamentous hemagglutinin
MAPVVAASWGEGSFNSPEESLEWHFEKHGEEVGASTPEEYLQKAEAFKNNLRGARKSSIEGATEDVVRFTKNGKYVDIQTSTGKIVSFGAAK